LRFEVKSPARRRLRTRTSIAQHTRRRVSCRVCVNFHIFQLHKRTIIKYFLIFAKTIKYLEADKTVSNLKWQVATPKANHSSFEHNEAQCKMNKFFYIFQYFIVTSYNNHMPGWIFIPLPYDNAFEVKWSATPLRKKKKKTSTFK